MDKFDNYLKEKIRKENWNIPNEFDKNIDYNLQNIHGNKFKLLNSKKNVLLVACICIICLGTGTVYSNARSIISYFASKTDSKYVSYKDNIENYSAEVFKGSKDKGIEVTIDNITLDDNYLIAFYTIKSDDPFQNNYMNQVMTPHFKYAIDNKDLEYGNHSDTEIYQESANVMKVMDRINVSLNDINNICTLKISTDKVNEVIGNWNVSVPLNKSEIEKETLTVRPNIEREFFASGENHKVTIDKVSISPFGSQIVLKESNDSDNVFSSFIIRDENNNNLDVLNTDIVKLKSSNTLNSFEFIKANTNMKYISLIPVREDTDEEGGKLGYNILDLQELPKKVQLNSQGSIIVEKYGVVGNTINISYKTEGIVINNVSFDLYDEYGNKLGNDYEGISDFYVDRQTGEFTSTIKFINPNADLSKIKKIGFCNRPKIKVYEDQAVKIKLQD